MTGDRYVLLGLARPRAAWFRDVGRWATSAVVPAEFLKCVSVEELRVRLDSGRSHSAVLLDGTLPAVDRDLIGVAREAGCVAVVVDDGRTGRDWTALGAAAVLAPDFPAEALLDVLAASATMVGRGAAVVDTGVPRSQLDEGSAPASVVAVLGPGGTGASTVAAALAQGLGYAEPGRRGLGDAESASSGSVLLADLALHAEQAMLHDVRDVVPGIQDLVEAHRSGRPSAEAVRALTFSVVDRRYSLLLGLRQARYWATLRPRAFSAAFESLRAAYATVVCDVAADLEGEDDGGSSDVEDRNLMARTVVPAADLVFAVGRPGVKGVHALVRVLSDLGRAGIPAGRIVPVVNLAPRAPRARAELSRALADLAAPALGGGRTVAPVFLPTRRVEEAMRDAVRLPAPLPGLLAGAYRAVVDRLGSLETPSVGPPEIVRPGSVGSWSQDRPG